MTDKARKQIARCRDRSAAMRPLSLFEVLDRADYIKGEKALELRWPVEFPDDYRDTRGRWPRIERVEPPTEWRHKRDIADRDKALLHSLFNRYTDAGDGRHYEPPVWMRHPLAYNPQAMAFMAALKGYDRTLCRRVVKGMYADWLPMPLLYPDPIKPNRAFNTPTIRLKLDPDLVADDETHPYGEKDLLRQLITAEPRAGRRRRMAAILCELTGVPFDPAWMPDALRETDGDDPEPIRREKQYTPERELKALAALRKQGVLKGVLKATTGPATTGDVSQLRRLAAINEERAKHGLPARTLDQLPPL
ncbi:hypothetical protein PQR53_08460 [Paraburkholderia fungorum]|uniref:hypothetical protein n=1 Tax=Paraburkholderia fungorum TaxID=134537 RepID=UPI0038BB3A67